MGKKSAPSAPPPVDPYQVAQTDAYFNRINQYTPWGSIEYGGPDRNMAFLRLDSNLQANLDEQMRNDRAMTGQATERIAGLDPNQIDLSEFGPIQSEIDTSFYNPRYLDFGDIESQINLGNALDTSRLPGLPQDVGALRDEVESAFFNRADRLLAPKYEQMERSLRDTLVNQGLPQSDEAYNTEFSNFYDERGRTYGDLANSAVLFGGQEATRELQNALAARQQGFGELGQAVDILTGLQSEPAAFNNAVDLQRIGVEQQQLQNRNTGRSQGLSEQAGIRQNAFNELAAMLGLQQVQAPQLNSFYGPGQVDYLGAANLSANQAMQQYQMDMQRSNAALGGLFSLGSSLLYGGGINDGGIPGLFGMGK
jgi:hypothetical protein